MRSISLVLLVLIAADAPFAAADGAPPARTSVAAVDRECLARHARRDRAELERARVPARTAATAPVVRPGVGALRIALDPVSGKPTFEVVPYAVSPDAR